MLAIIGYYRVEEPLVSSITDAREPVSLPKHNTKAPAARSEELRRSHCVTKHSERLSQCFIYVGKALVLPAGDPNLSRLCNEFYSTHEALRHFWEGHLNLVPKNAENGICPSATL